MITSFGPYIPEPNSSDSNWIDALCSQPSACQENLREIVSLGSLGRTAGSQNRPLLSPSLPPKHLAVFHHEFDVLQRLDVAQRISTHRDNVGERARNHHADFALHIEHHSRARRGALDRV